MSKKKSVDPQTLLNAIIESAHDVSSYDRLRGLAEENMANMFREKVFLIKTVEKIRSERTASVVREPAPIRMAYLDSLVPKIEKIATKVAESEFKYIKMAADYLATRPDLSRLAMMLKYESSDIIKEQRDSLQSALYYPPKDLPGLIRAYATNPEGAETHIETCKTAFYNYCLISEKTQKMFDDIKERYIFTGENADQMKQDAIDAAQDFINKMAELKQRFNSANDSLGKMARTGEPYDRPSIRRILENSRDIPKNIDVLPHTTDEYIAACATSQEIFSTDFIKIINRISNLESDVSNLRLPNAR